MPRNVSDRSSQESTSSSLLHPSRTSPALIPRHDDSQTPELSPLADTRLTITPVPSIQGSLNPQAPPTPTTPATAAVDDESSVDDWGIDELSDDDDAATEAATIQQSARDLESLDSIAFTGGNQERTVPVASVRSGGSSKNMSHRDIITLRAFDENIDQQAKLVASDLARVNNYIGLYADPAAEAVDWGDDFDLEQSSSKPGDVSSGSRTGDEGPSSFPSWFIEKDPTKNEFEFKVEISEAPPPVSAMRNQYHPATAEILPGGDDTLRMRSVPPSAFATPSLSHSSLLSFPGVGYQASVVHPSCTRVKELFSRYDVTVRRHFDALVRDSGGTSALDKKTRSVYQMSADSDVSKLAKANKDLSADVLVWKLQWATLKNSSVDHAKLLLGLSNIFKDAGNYKEATRLVKEAIKAVSGIEDSNLSLAIAAELEYELAVLNRALGTLGESEKAVKRAMTHSAVLSLRPEETVDLPGPQQRGLWWQLRCKFLLAELSYDRENFDTAVQFFSEYIVEGITRMIGLIAPPRSEDTTLGTEFMRYCLFSPRRLVLAMWTTLLCLGNMRCFAAAADTAALTSLVASSFGYEDANMAGTNIRLRIKDIAVELRQQYEQISKTILRSSNLAAEDLILPGGNQIPGSQFDYNVGDFGEMGDEVAEDWDAQLEKELNITIERCCGVDQSNETSSLGTEGNTAPSPFTSEAFAVALPDRGGSSSRKGLGGRSDGNGEGRKPQQSTSRWQTGPHYGNLIDAELRQYLGRVGGAASTLSAQQMFPKPTQPFDGRLMGPREHENFLRRFVRGKDPVLSGRVLHGLPVTALWNPSAVCKVSLEIDPTEDADLLGNSHAILTPDWGLQLLDVVWKIVRADIAVQTKQSRLRQLLLHSVSKISKLSKRTPVHDEGDRQNRLDMLASLLESLRLAREIISETGCDAVWFSRTCMFLGIAAATVTPAAKAAVELFQAESRAHCGVKAVISGLLLERCANAEQERVRHRHEHIRSDIITQPAMMVTRSPIPTALQQSVVDVMHALYWRTKAGFDESSDADSLERLIHADVASGLFLTGCGLSPVDGSPIDVAAETKLLHISERKHAKSEDPNALVDETRRVSASELIQELQSLWSSLPSSAGLVRAKVSFALAHHSRMDQRDYGRAERFLFDGLRSVHAVSPNQEHPHSFFSRLLLVSPVSIVSSPLAEAILHCYGTLAVTHSKYRYGIAALEASTDARRVRTMNKQSYRSSVMSVIESASANNDWRRALVLLYSLRTLVDPKDGRRNEFLQLCLKLHRICFDVGCFEASIVPLRAYSALIYEERLRVLLQRYRRRLAKKARNRIRRRLPGPPLPKLLPGGSVFPNGKNSLASFFETPVVNSAIDNTIRQSTALFEMRPRSTTAMVPVSTTRSGNGVFKKLVAFLWPVPTNVYRSTSRTGASVTNQKQNRVTSSSSGEGNKEQPIMLPPKVPVRHQAVVTSPGQVDAGRFEEEQRELLRIEAEQEVAADSDRFRVELLRAQTEYAKADFIGAELRCRGLLEMRIPHAGRYKVLEILARIRLKRREVTRCLELVDQMEQEYCLAEASRDQPDESQPPLSEENQRVSIFRLHDQGQEAKKDEKPSVFSPVVTFLRLSALIHGGRLNEALYLADKSIESCAEHSFWDLGRLHYLRGKALAAMSSSATAPLQREKELEKGPKESQQLILNVTELTLIAFETASRFFDAAGDEVSTSKADLLWARTSIDFLFRKVVLKDTCGGGIPLNDACTILNRCIIVQEVVDVIYNVINLATTANLPVLLVDAMAALAEIKCIQKHPSSTWMLWVSEAWKLFSRLFTNAENFTVVLDELAPVSTLFRLRNLCGRLVRLVMCDEHYGNVSDMNKHLRLFEAYVTLQISIDRKMNLSSSAHRTSSASPTSQDETQDPDIFSGDEARPSAVSTSPSAPPGRTKKKNGLVGASLVRLRFPKTQQSSDRKGSSSANDVLSDSISDTASEKSAPRRPAGAFLHILGDEGVALGRQGFSVFINRPRQQVISAVKGTGAVLIPTNFFTNSKAAPGHELGRDAELIFPFKPKVGLGAMQILDDTKGGIDERIEMNQLHPMEYMRGVGKDLSDEDDEVNRRNSMKSAIDDALNELGDRQSVHAYENEREPRLSTRGPLLDEKSEERRPPLAGVGGPEIRNNAKKNKRNELAELLKAIRDELEGGSIQTKGSSQIFGQTTADRVWAHMHRIKTETGRYMHGEITLDQLHDRNNDALLGWVHCIPLSRKEWTVPESIGRRLVYILYAHGVVGYYAVDRGGSIESIAFGGKQSVEETTTGNSFLRCPTKAERLYLSELVKGFKRDEVWHKNRDSEIVNGMANQVLRAPRLLLSSSSPAQKSRSRPIVLIADLPLQILPWELFFDHVVIRSHCLLDVIRGLQDEASQSQSSLLGVEDPAIAASKKIARFISFGPSRREVLDLERTEDARRQQLAFQGLLRLNHMNPASIIAFLGLGGFSDPTAINAVPRPTGPLSSPLSQSRKAVKLFGLRISANIGRRNYPHMDFLKVPGLGSATTWDLKEAAMVLQPTFNDKDEPKRDLGAYVPVFMFTYADLVDSSDSVFGLRRLVPNGILMFTPAVHMKVLAKHLEDDELSVELGRASGRIHNRIFPDIIASARVLVEYVSRFSREKRIPIVVFLGQGLVDVFPRKRGVKSPHGRKTAPAAERLAQLHGAGRVFSAQ